MEPPTKKRRTINFRSEVSPPPLRRNARTLTTPVVPPVPIPSTNPNTLKIMSWNVNGVKPFLQQNSKITSFFSHSSPTKKQEASLEEGYSLRGVLRRHKWPAMLCLQEVKISPKDSATKRDLERAANYILNSKSSDPGPHYTAFFSLPRDRYNATGFGGKVHGVCTLIRDDVLEETSAVTREVDWDLEGRVLITEFEAWKLAVINGYWVNGTNAPYRSPTTGEVTGTRHDHKRAFHSLMLAEVQSLQAKPYEVVLIGDMNVARSHLDGFPGLRMGDEHVRSRADFNSRFCDGENGEGIRGVDSWREMRGATRAYTYHGERAEEWGRSCDRVDLGIVSRGLVERGVLVGAEIWESVEERGWSDHVPIGVVLDMERLWSLGKGERGVEWEL